MIRLVELRFGEEEEEAVLGVLRSGRLAQGPRVREFEGAFSSYVGTEWGVAVSSGTAALELSLRALGIGRGDEVVVPAFTFIATSNAALWVGARPRFVDVLDSTLNLDPDALNEAISPRTKAVIAVHLYGHPADVKAIREICDDAGVYLIEDAAQAHGAEAYGSRAGSFGDLAVFSFYATKNLTTGEGGIVLGSDRELERRLRLLRDQGQESKYNHVSLGMNYRMTELQAALGIVQLGRLNWVIRRRRENAEALSSRLKGLPVRTPVEEGWAKHAFHQYVVRLPGWAKRERIMELMRDMGVETAVHYPRPVPGQPLYRKLGYRAEDFPVALRASKEVLSLPVHQFLGDEEMRKVADSLKRALELSIGDG